MIANKEINTAERDMAMMAEAGYEVKCDNPIGCLVHEPTRTRISVYKPMGWFRRKLIELCFGFKYEKL